MLDAITAAQVAMDQDQLKMQAVSQNISNMHTPGYKRQIIAGSGFDEHLLANLENASKRMQVSSIHEQGTLTQTLRPLDLAISGSGYFQVQTDDGLFYTRRGDFHINEQGLLTTASGGLILGNSGPIRVDDNQFAIDKLGNVLIDNIKVDQLSIVNFTDTRNLDYSGSGLFKTQDTPQPINGSSHIMQGFVEQANVKSIDEMMEMVKISRHFESSQRIMRMADALMTSAINQLGEGNV